MNDDSEKLEWIKKNQHICMNPWNTASVRADNDGSLVVDPCCNIFRTKKYEPFSLEPIDNIKQAINKGYLPVECRICKTEESKGLMSERIRHLLYEDFDTIKEFERTRKIDTFMLGARFSNLCNLACKSCDEFQSSVWANLVKKDIPSAVIEDITDLPEFWETFEKIYNEHTDKSFVFLPMGGETMLQLGLTKTLAWFLDKGYNKSIKKIYITTNLTVLKKTTMDLLDKFNIIELSGSIDSVSDNFHYVRWPAKFETVEKNLEKIVSLLNKNKELNYKKYEFSIVITWSLNNIWHVEEILDYWHNWMQKNNTDIKISCINLHQPKFLVIQTMPNPYRKILSDIVKKAVTHPIFNDGKNDILKIYLDGLIVALQDQSLIDKHRFSAYIKNTAEIDIKQKVRMKDYNKLYDLLTPYHKMLYDNIIESFYDNRGS